MNTQQKPITLSEKKYNCNNPRASKLEAVPFALAPRQKGNFPAVSQGQLPAVLPGEAAG